MLKEAPPASPTASLPAGRVLARVCAALQQTEQACAELLILEELLSFLSVGAADLAQSSATMLGAEATEPSLRRDSADERTAEEHLLPQKQAELPQWDCEVCRNWCATPEAKNAFHSSGLSTAFSALERSVSDAAVLSISSKLQRVTDKVRQLSSILDTRVQYSRRKLLLLHARAQWTWEATSALHQVAHASLEREDARASKLPVATACVAPAMTPRKAQDAGESDVFPVVSDAIWWNVQAGLRGVLQRTIPYAASPAFGISDEVVVGRVELQQRRLLALLEEMTTCLVGDASAAD
ncbi:hypothetical protein LSCM1_00582 [Leishmania martiniquensis]|uniref:Uncharacterized protein n=1 Tax=Leishmania martiniquensis TaxID=1580590 RepID=A0A836GUK4_9TRYP|nr:hypothetical protein LSCM1_00582 [Leishmania martiniquensis]